MGGEGYEEFGCKDEVEQGATDWSKGTDGVVPDVSPTASYADFFAGWKETQLQKVNDDPSITKAVVESSPLSRASNIAVINGLALNSKAATEFIEGKKRYQLAFETLKLPALGNKNFFDLQRELASARKPATAPQPFPRGGVPDNLSGVLPPATATINIGSVKVTFDSSAEQESAAQESANERKRRLAKDRKKRQRDAQSTDANAQDLDKARIRMANKRADK